MRKATSLFLNSSLVLLLLYSMAQATPFSIDRLTLLLDLFILVAEHWAQGLTLYAEPYPQCWTIPTMPYAEPYPQCCMLNHTHNAVWWTIPTMLYVEPYPQCYMLNHTHNAGPLLKTLQTHLYLSCMEKPFVILLQLYFYRPSSSVISALSSLTAASYLLSLCQPHILLLSVTKLVFTWASLLFDLIAFLNIPS